MSGHVASNTAHEYTVDLPGTPVPSRPSTPASPPQSLRSRSKLVPRFPHQPPFNHGGSPNTVDAEVGLVLGQPKPDSPAGHTPRGASSVPMPLATDSPVPFGASVSAAGHQDRAFLAFVDRFYSDKQFSDFQLKVLYELKTKGIKDHDKNGHFGVVPLTQRESSERGFRCYTETLSLLDSLIEKAESHPDIPMSARGPAFFNLCKQRICYITIAMAAAISAGRYVLFQKMDDAEDGSLALFGLTAAYVFVQVASKVLYSVLVGCYERAHLPVDPDTKQVHELAELAKEAVPQVKEAYAEAWFKKKLPEPFQKHVNKISAFYNFITVTVGLGNVAVGALLASGQKTMADSPGMFCSLMFVNLLRVYEPDFSQRLLDRFLLGTKHCCESTASCCVASKRAISTCFARAAEVLSSCGRYTKAKCCGSATPVRALGAHASGDAVDLNMNPLASAQRGAANLVVLTRTNISRLNANECWTPPVGVSLV